MTLVASATLIDYQAARAARGLSASVPPDAYQLGQPVTVLGRPSCYGWVSGVARCPLTGSVSYTIQTPQGRIVCREAALRGRTDDREV